MIDNEASKYIQILGAITTKLVRLGYTTIRIFEPAQIEEAQFGYAHDREGKSLVSGGAGGWQEAWLVIGYEDLCGDPIFIDRQTNDFPVYTAIHGVGSWDPVVIATSLQSFGKALKVIEEVSKERETPVGLERNPITLDEKERAFTDIRKIMPNVEIEFWESLLG